MHRHDAAYVDAYYGPPEWKTEAEQQTRPLAEIDAEAARLVVAMGAPPKGESPDDLRVLRHVYLRRQLEALRARVRMLSGADFTFDEESRALYDAVAPVRSELSFQTTLTELDALLPGRGPTIDRYDAFRKAFIIAPGRLGRVFDAAIAECRRRTLPHAA